MSLEHETGDDVAEANSTPSQSADQIESEQHSDDGQGTPPKFGGITVAEASKATAGFIGEVALEAVLGLLGWALLWGSLILAFVLPVAGLILGLIGLIWTFATDRSKILPIMSIAASIFYWAGSGTPLGMLSFFL